MTPAIPPGLTGALVVVSFVALFGFEAARPLRRRVEARVRRVARNLGTAGLSALAVLVLQPLVLVPAASAVVSHRVGLLALLDLPRPLAVALGVVLLDATLWIWHWLNHRVPLLWRFHLVHHVDLDLDVSTGLRFHFGEMALSVVYRAAQVALLGADPLAVSLWQLLLIPAVLRPPMRCSARM